MYYDRVPALAQTVFTYIRKHGLLRPGDRAGVAVSGGADSVALLRLLLELRSELGIVLSMVHFNHKLRGAESEEDERFVGHLAEQHELPLLGSAGEVAAHAAEKHLSLETAARAMRYEYFRELLRGGKLTRIATGHTLDDQAETVLLRMVRGAGTRGLAGIYPELSVSGQNSAAGAQPLSIVRPLLSTRRKDLEVYLQSVGQSWREDKSNRDLRHARNRVRHGILPRLERNLNPAVREALAETAEIARAEEDYWDQQVARVLPEVYQNSADRAVAKIQALEGLPLALRRRLVRRFAESLGVRLEFHHVESILEVAAAERGGGSATLPDGWKVSHHKDELRFEREAAGMAECADYEYRLPIPGAVTVPELRSTFEAVLISRESCDNPEQLIRREVLGTEVRIRNWRAGDRFWPAHTKAPKKIKELLYERRVNAREHKLWPVIVSGSEVVWMRGFASPAGLTPRKETEAVMIREVPLSGRT